MPKGLYIEEYVDSAREMIKNRNEKTDLGTILS